MAKDNAFIAEAKRRMAMQKARDMRFKKPMLADMNWEGIMNGLYDIEESCSDVAYWFDDDKNLVSAFDGDEDEAYEFKMVFADIEGNAVRLRQRLSEVENEMYHTGCDDMEEYFNNCTVALIGNRYDVIGFDSYEEDYLSLTTYEERLATTF